MCLWEDGEEWIEWIKKAHVHKCVCVCVCVQRNSRSPSLRSFSAEG